MGRSKHPGPPFLRAIPILLDMFLALVATLAFSMPPLPPLPGCVGLLLNHQVDSLAIRSTGDFLMVFRWAQSSA